MGLRDWWNRWGRNDEERAERGEEGGLGLPDEPISGDYVDPDGKADSTLPEPGDPEL